VQGFASMELLEAKFKGKHSEPIAGKEGSGEGIPVNRYNHVVGPAKVLLHKLFEEPKPFFVKYL
jgi:hypothetical protein